MSDKINATLKEAQAQYFAEVQYSFDVPEVKTTKSVVINHCLFELFFFEKIMDDQVSNWLLENHPEKYKQLLREWEGRF